MLRSKWGEAGNFINFPDTKLLRATKHEAGSVSFSEIHDIIFLLIYSSYFPSHFMLSEVQKEHCFGEYVKLSCPLGGMKIPGTSLQESSIALNNDEQGGLSVSDQSDALKVVITSRLESYNSPVTWLRKKTRGHLHWQKNDSQSSSSHLLLLPLEALWNKSDGAAP